MSKRKYALHLGILLIYFAAYITAVICESTFWGDIISPVGIILALIVLLGAFIKYRKSSIISWIYITLGLACLSWIVSDILWAIHELIFHIDPKEEELFMVLYLLPNIFIAITSGIIVFTRRNKVNTVQLVLDILAAVSTGTILIWLLFFRNQVDNLLHMDLNTLMVFLYALCDFFSISCIIIRIASLPRREINSTKLLLGTGIFLYSLIDIVYSYLYFQDIYIPNTLVDVIYMGSFLLLAAGSFRENFYGQSISSSDTNLSDEYNGKNIKTAFLLTAPIILILLGHDINVVEFALVLIIAIAYHIISSYIQAVTKNSKLLSIEKSMNAALEKSVAERTEQLLQSNNELDFLSKQDSITSLYNRRYFLAEFDNMIHCTSPEESIALFFIDLDRFKAINDTYGHDIGDSVLIEISNRLNHFNGKDSLLARLGGDEFVIAFRGHYDIDQADTIAKQLLQCCDQPIVVDLYEFHVTLSIGITFFPADASERGILMKNADIAMYHAKGLGCNQYAFYSSLLNDQVIRRSHLELLLKKADYDKEFELVYQPQVLVSDKKLIGAEALLRWNNPEVGLVMPGEFIPIAEETGLILSLSDWIIMKALHQAAHWNCGTARNLKIGINISFKQLNNIRFVEKLQKAMKECSVQPGWVDIEITENMAMNEADKSKEVFRIINEQGITVSIDDFGTGYSSLSYLKQFSIDRIKIAKSLVDNLAMDYRDANIIKAIIAMAKALGIKVIAEGVEHESQFRILSEFGCDEVQGYLTGKPFSVQDFESIFLEAHLVSQPEPNTINPRYPHS